MPPMGPGVRTKSRGLAVRGLLPVRLSSLLSVLLLAGLAAACGPSSDRPGDAGPRPPASEAAAPREPAPPRRGIEPDSAEGHSASLLRVQIGSETRPVLGVAPRRVLRWRDPVTLDGERLRVEVELPRELLDRAAPGSRLRVDVSASVQPEAFRGKDALEARATETGRQRLAAAPRVLDVEALRAAPRLAVELPVPEAMRGLGALVDVVARPLPAPVASWPMGPFPVSGGDRLRFGYGVEREGASPGWPPVHFRVLARAAGGPERLLFERRLDPSADPRDGGWHDADVGLAAVASPATRFRFEARAVALPGAEQAPPATFAVFSAPEVMPERDSASGGGPPPWNVVLVSLDTLRARSVGAYGAARDTTPALDRRVAARGARVRDAVVPVPFTPPAHMSMLTGLEPCAHRVEDRHGVLPPDRLTLAEVLRREGYRTAAFTENGYVVAGAGFARGFDRYFEQISEESASPGFAPEILAAAGDWLEREGARPFFLFLHTYQVHAPYAPPRGYLELFRDDATAAYGEPYRANLDAYEREIRYLDDLMAGFLDRLEELGLAERTLLVVTSDHGEGFGEHFWTGHGLDAHDESIRVPLLVRAPGLVPAGRVIDTPMGLIDLVPTLLDLLGLPPLPDLQGRSFASLFRGQADTLEDRPLVTSSTNGVSIRTRRSKLLRAHRKDWRFLYDLEADPAEKVNLYPERPDEAAELEAVYQSWKRRCAELAAAASEAAARRGGPQPGWLINRDEIDAKLRSLGYIE